jgi:hypothetical protein
MALKVWSAIAEGLLHAHQLQIVSLSIQRSIKWYADTDFGIFAQWLALLRTGLLGVSARKDTT